MTTSSNKNRYCTLYFYIEAGWRATGQYHSAAAEQKCPWGVRVESMARRTAEQTFENHSNRSANENE